MDLDPTDATLPSNRSLCWLRLGQAEHALADAKTCRGLRPDWPKACYREGAALRLLEACSQLFFNIASFSLNRHLKKKLLLFPRDMMKQPMLFMRA